jgi:hypothetical protein
MIRSAVSTMAHRTKSCSLLRRIPKLNRQRSWMNKLGEKFVGITKRRTLSKVIGDLASGKICVTFLDACRVLTPKLVRDGLSIGHRLRILWILPQTLQQVLVVADHIFAKSLRIRRRCHHVASEIVYLQETPSRPGTSSRVAFINAFDQFAAVE